MITARRYATRCGRCTGAGVAAIGPVPGLAARAALGGGTDGGGGRRCTAVTRAAESTSGQRSTCARDLRLRSRCHARKAAVIPLASRAT